MRSATRRLSRERIVMQIKMEIDILADDDGVHCDYDCRFNRNRGGGSMASPTHMSCSLFKCKLSWEYKRYPNGQSLPNSKRCDECMAQGE